MTISRTILRSSAWADFLHGRRRSPEQMDEDAADPGQIDRSLAFIRWINRALGYTRSTLGHLAAFSRGWRRGQRIELLDLATGSADVPIEILAWAQRHGWDIRITAVDRHPATIAFAARSAREAGIEPSRLRLVQADVFELPFAAGSFDYVLSSMFLHHLDEERIVRALATMDRMAARGILAADLIRDVRAYAWIQLFTLFGNRMVRHDALASVAGALTGAEIRALRDRAGVGYAAYHEHFGYRYTLAGEKGLPGPGRSC